MNRPLPERMETPRLLLRQWHADDAPALKAVIDSSLPHLQQWLEIGYWLGAAETGRGFMTEATDALTRLALQHDGISRVRIKCDPDNLPSAGVPRRLGYRHIGTVSEALDAAPKMMWEFAPADRDRAVAPVATTADELRSGR